MAHSSLIQGILIFGCAFISIARASDDDLIEYMTKEEREALKEEARDMFYHGYNAYMDNAYPADELMPLSCKGRYRGSESNRGDIDTALGNFSLTLVDTMDTLVLLGDLEEFENAVRLVLRDVSFDTDVIVSVFETNIRMLGGLLSSHILAEYLQQRADIMPWYKGELLTMAKDLGYRFLPAFNTTTGIPYGRINLKNGMKGIPLEATRETCTACAGSMILEMAALSRLTGEPIFEEKAQRAMDSLWRMRHRGTDLMGSVLNVNSGDWVRRDSGVGAGIDSYYEYCLKAYILLGDEKYLGRFNKHYQAVMKYISQGPMLLDVHMHRPNTNSKNFMDALLAFWPGLQVLKGDIKPAVETHEMLYQVMQRHNFIPEAFTTDFQVHWGHHPLRPEFLESTYFLYRATGDHYYLGVGRKVLRSLQTYARVPCGYAAVSDVRTNKHDDTMDSFVLSETFKYLFLLFADPSELVLDPDEFVFTTEGHLLPLTLASIGSNTSLGFEKDVIDVDEFDRTCPNSLHLFPASVRQPLRNMVEDVCPRHRTMKRKINAAQFQANNLEHLSLLGDMGITILTRADGRVQLLHTFANANTAQDAEEGLLFMHEMVELSKMQTQQAETKPQAVTFTMPTFPQHELTLLAGPAHFGRELRGPNNKVTGKVVYADPPTACTELVNTDKLLGKIAIMNRGDCMFVEKARRVQKAGAIAGIVLDNVAGSSASTFPMFAMSGDGNEADYVVIPIVFLFNAQAVRLLGAMGDGGGELVVTIGEYIAKEEVQLKAPNDLSMFERLKGKFKEFVVRQMSPQQNPASGNTATPTINKTGVIREEDHKIIVEFEHLKAEITTDEKISITMNPDKALETLDELSEISEFEKRWRIVREKFITQIFTMSKLGSSVCMEGLSMRMYYDVVQTERALPSEIVNHSIRIAEGPISIQHLSEKVLWFLKELGQSKPDTSLFDKIHEIQKLLKMLEAEKKPPIEKFLRELFQGKNEMIDPNIPRLAHIDLTIIHTSNPFGPLMDQLEKEIDNLLVMNDLQESKEDDIVIGDAEPSTNKGRENDENVRGFGKTEESNSQKLDDFEEFILTEIEKAVQTPNSITLLQSETSVNSLKNLNADKPDDTSANLDAVMVPHNEDNIKNVKAPLDVEMLAKESDLLKSIEIIYMTREKVLQEMHREISNSRNSMVDKLNRKGIKPHNIPREEEQSSDPLNDLKKPVWASDKEKVAKEFSEFQERSGITSKEYTVLERNNLEYREKKYVGAPEEKENFNSMDSEKHINDEL
ncbi:ER degradation-enhancing alpha-mannosidase-like protein 3 isoform X2 [Athalia rosae]|uniref:ER degradation-enhancing alpha-mannosidase-like protein 3 isoform X2 n=1 Tax=Athalia rosae TaxID=37344 RepID=UPI0020333E1F|nr:ER degradation-enhancing alpha-mannosidase-like protein 3 isoform X2 [Athalia rosae]